MNIYKALHKGLLIFLSLCFIIGLISFIDTMNLDNSLGIFNDVAYASDAVGEPTTVDVSNNYHDGNTIIVQEDGVYIGLIDSSGNILPSSTKIFDYNPNGYRFTGTTSYNAIDVKEGVTATIYLKDLSITNISEAGPNAGSCIDVSGANSTIILEGINDLKCLGGDTYGTGTGGCALEKSGMDGSCVIKGNGTLNASGNTNVLHSGAIGSSFHKDAIGQGGFSHFTIESGTINAIAGLHSPGIGAMCRAEDLGILNKNPVKQYFSDVHITGGTINATGSDCCAGIGTGYGSPIDGLYISGGAHVIATGGKGSPGIGTGSLVGDPASFPATDLSISNIVISGGDTIVQAIGYDGGGKADDQMPGIGCGKDYYNRYNATRTTSNIVATPDTGWLSVVRQGMSSGSDAWSTSTYVKPPSDESIDINPTQIYTLVYFGKLSKTASVNGGDAQTGTSDNKIPVSANDTIKYTIDTTQWGTQQGSENYDGPATISDTIPDGLTLVEDSSTYTAGMKISDDKKTVSWDVKLDDGHTTGTYSFTVKVDPITTATVKDYINQATLERTGQDTTSPNQHLIIPTTKTYHHAKGITDLTFNKIDQYGNAVEGAGFTLYKYTVDSSGNCILDPTTLYKTEVKSGTDGSVSFSGVTVESDYVLVETTTPGSIKAPEDGSYIHVAIGSTGNVTTMTGHGTFAEDERIVAPTATSTNYQVVNTRTHSLTVSKTVAGNAGEKDRDFTFTVTLKDKEGNALTGSYAYTGSAIEGVTAPADGTLTLDSSGQGTVTLKHGQSIKISDLAQGTQYTVVEKEANTDGYVTTSTGGSSLGITGDATAAFTNTRTKTDVTFDKIDQNKDAVVGAGFTLYACTNTTEGHQHGADCTWDATKPVYQEVKSDADGKVTIPGVITNKDYIMVETTVPSGYQKLADKSYIVLHVDSNGTITMTGFGDFASDMVTKSDSSYKVTDTKLFDIAISKTVAGNAGEQDRDFHFTISVKDKNETPVTGEYTYSGSAIDGVTAPTGGTLTLDASGQAVISLKHGQSIDIKGFAPHTQYSVTEKEANTDGYITASTDAASSDLTQNMTAAFTNTRTKTDVTFDKIDQNKDAVVGAGFTLYACTNTTDGHQHGADCTWDTTKPVYQEVKSDADGKVTIPGVITNKDYIMVETTVPSGYKKLADKSYIVLHVASENTITMTGFGDFANDMVTKSGSSYKVANTKLFNITISNTVNGNAGEQNRAFNFTISVKDKDGNPVTGEYNYSGSAIDGVTAPDDGTLTLDANGQAVISLKHGQSIDIKDFVPHTQYTVTEKEANTEGYITTASDDTCLDLTQNMTAAFVNTRTKTDVVFDKIDQNKDAVEGAGFTLYECTNTTEGHQHGTDCTWDATNPAYQEVKSTADGTVTIPDVITNKDYIMVETTVPTGYQKLADKSYIVLHVASDNTITMTGFGDFAKDTMITEPALLSHYKVMNTKLFNITVSKTVSGNAGEKDRYFQFTLTAKDKDGKPLTGKYDYQGTAIDGVVKPADGTLNFDANGQAVITLKHGQSIEVKYFAPHTQFTVTEKEANTDGYITNASGQINSDLVKDATVSFDNNKVVLANANVDTGVYQTMGAIEGIMILVGTAGFILVARHQMKKTH